MKTLTRTVLQCSLFVLIFSCSNTDEPINEVLPKNLNNVDLALYIRSHTKEVQKISLQELSEVKINTQRQVHRVLSSERRYSLWKQKFDLMLAQEQWSEQEKEYLNNFKNTLTIKLFEGNDEELKKFKLYANKWREDALHILHWTPKEIKHIATSYSIHNPESINITYNDPEEPECNCSTQDTWWCGEDPCVGYHEPGGGCEYSIPGCGFLLMFSCDGFCTNS